MDVGLEAKPISDYAWSPDSRWLAYSKIGLDLVANVYLYSIVDGAIHNVSNGLFNDFGPAFTPRRPAPALRLQPALRPDLLRLRVGDGLQERGRHLCR